MRAAHTTDPKKCLQDIAYSDGASAPSVRTNGIAQAVLRNLRCGDVLHSGDHRYAGAERKLYVDYCWPDFSWDAFNSYELIRYPHKTIAPGNNNGASDVVKMLLAASTLNRIPTCSTLFVPASEHECDMVCSRVNPLLACQLQELTPITVPPPGPPVSASSVAHSTEHMLRRTYTHLVQR